MAELYAAGCSYVSPKGRYTQGLLMLRKCGAVPQTAHLLKYVGVYKTVLRCPQHPPNLNFGLLSVQEWAERAGVPLPPAPAAPAPAPAAVVRGVSAAPLALLPAVPTGPTATGTEPAKPPTPLRRSKRRDMVQENSIRDMMRIRRAFADSYAPDYLEVC